MNKFLDTSDKLNYVDYSGACQDYVFDLDQLPKEGYSIQEVYNLMEQWSDTIVPGTAAHIVIKSDTKGKNDCLSLFYTFLSIFSKRITTELKEGEKRLAPRTQIMEATSVDLVTMKRFLNYKSKVRYLQIEVTRKGKSLAAL